MLTSSLMGALMQKSIESDEASPRTKLLMQLSPALFKQNAALTINVSTFDVDTFVVHLTMFHALQRSK